MLPFPIPPLMKRVLLYCFPPVQMAFQGTLYVTDRHTAFSVEERGRKLPFKVAHGQVVRATRQRPARKGEGWAGAQGGLRVVLCVRCGVRRVRKAWGGEERASSWGAVGCCGAGAGAVGEPWSVLCSRWLLCRPMRVHGWGSGSGKRACVVTSLCTYHPSNMTCYPVQSTHNDTSCKWRRLAVCKLGLPNTRLAEQVTACMSAAPTGPLPLFAPTHSRTDPYPPRVGDLSDILKLELSNGQWLAFKDFESGSALDSALALVEHLTEQEREQQQHKQ